MKRSSLRKFKSICVFYGPFLGKRSEYMSAANNLGTVLAARGINMIYGGGNMGLLGCVASAAKLGECMALAIIPKAFAVRNVHGVSLGNELHVVSLHEKMGNMHNNADALIALPGGLGTLEGILKTTFKAQLYLHQKPLELLNVNGFSDGLLSYLDHAVEYKFMKPATQCMFVSAPTVDQRIDQLLAYVPESDPRIQELATNLKDSRKRKEPDQDLDLTLRLFHSL